jgi:Uma2 family endonuclease
MQVTEVSDGGRVVLRGVSWSEYLRTARSLRERRFRMTYDRGRLEIVSPSPLHERLKSALDQMVTILVEEIDLPSDDLGSTTFRRSDLKKGVEPDACYDLDNAHRIRGKQRINLRSDPPPDLAIEADITASSSRRLRVYAAFGAPEVRRFENDRVDFLRLTAARRYTRRAQSTHFPGFSSADATRFALEALNADKTAWRKAFRAWVRANLLPH